MAKTRSSSLTVFAEPTVLIQARKNLFNWILQAYGLTENYSIFWYGEILRFAISKR